MSDVDDFRNAALSARQVAADLGMRPTTVSIVLETYDRAVNLAGATLTSTIVTELSPSPRVDFIGALPGAFGGGLRSGPDARIDTSLVRIGPITPSCTAGGLSNTAFNPAFAGPQQRMYLLLEGEAFSAGGERYQVETIDGERPIHYYVNARRTNQS